MKIKPAGICDFCGGEIKLSWRTTKNQLRQYCSIECRNTANAQAGNPARIEKVKQNVKNGKWKNPAAGITHEQIVANAKKGGAAAGAKFKAQVAAGTWVNPALSKSARKKLSRPRTIKDLILHEAISKLSHGMSVNDLPKTYAVRYRAYRRRKGKFLRKKHLILKFIKKELRNAKDGNNHSG
jgi:ribosomal protein L29